MLSGPEIERQIDLGNIQISPFKRERVGPNSVDLCLGETLLMYSEVGREVVDVQAGRFRTRVRAINTRSPPETVPAPFVRTQFGPGWLIQPNKGYLGRTVERISARGYVPIIDGRSTYGRMFVWCHVTAGLGDDGWGEQEDGTLTGGTFTLEIGASEPAILYPGDPICQILFHPLVGDRRPYWMKGRYNLQVEPTPAKPVGGNGV